MPGLPGTVGPWLPLQKALVGITPAKFQASSNKAVLREAHRLRREMVKAYNRGGPKSAKWEPLKERTLAMRAAMGFKGTKPLMRTGDLRNSITVVQPEPSAAFVGFHRNTAMKNGKKAFSIASIHEFGKEPYGIHVTPGMRNFFMAMNIKSGGKVKPLFSSTTIIIVEIPARPLMNPIWEENKDEAGERIASDTLKGVGLSKLLGL